MTKKDLLIKEISKIPETSVDEVLNHVRAIILKSRNENSVASEKVLAKDWLSPEEDKAWNDL